jgi:hypothetical protein
LSLPGEGRAHLTLAVMRVQTRTLPHVGLRVLTRTSDRAERRSNLCSVFQLTNQGDPSLVVDWRSVVGAQAHAPESHRGDFP